MKKMLFLSTLMAIFICCSKRNEPQDYKTLGNSNYYSERISDSGDVHKYFLMFGTEGPTHIVDSCIALDKYGNANSIQMAKMEGTYTLEDTIIIFRFYSPEDIMQKAIFKNDSIYYRNRVYFKI